MDTEIFTITDPVSGKNEIDRAGEYLRKGEIVAIPTETVYGLAASAFDGEAVKKIFLAKGRPQDNPLIVHIADIQGLYQIAREVPQKALELAEKYWPGPLTIILPKKDIIPDEVSAGLSTVAVRMPSHPVAQAVIRSAGVPLAAPSANISGFPSPTRAEYVIDDMKGAISCIIDGGDCEFGIESTVVTLATATPRLLRPGAITHEQLEAVLGKVDIDPAVLNPLQKGEVAASPGMKYKHYSPNAQIFVVKGDFDDYIQYLKNHSEAEDFALCFEGEEDKIPLKSVTMGNAHDPLTQSHRLFDAFRELDKLEAKRVFARSPSQKGVGLGVCNRLYRAAAFRFLELEPRDLLSPENIEKLIKLSENKGKIIGISGGTGSGKSTVSAFLQGLGAEITDADKIAREVTEKGSAVLTELARCFGEDILTAHGELDRRLLAQRAFANAESTERLSAITHPAIVEICKARATESVNSGKTALIDAPLLFSSGLAEICDVTVFVTADENVRLNRITKRDGITTEEAQKRIDSQKQELSLCRSADIIIEN